MIVQAPEGRKPIHDLRVRSLIELKRFWLLFEARHPAEANRSTLRQRRNRQRPLPDLALVIRLFVSEADGYVGVFFGRNARLGVDRARLDAVADALRERLDEQPWRPASFGHFGSLWYVDVSDELNWPAMTDWLVAEADRLEAAARFALSAALSRDESVKPRSAG